MKKQHKVDLKTVKTPIKSKMTPRTQVLLQLGEGITRNVLDWGAELLRFHGKAPTAPDANVHVPTPGKICIIQILEFDRGRYLWMSMSSKLFS